MIFAGRHTQVKRAANSWIHDILSLNTNKYKSSSPPAPSRQSSEATPEAPPRWSRPGRLWFAPPPHGWTSSLSAGCVNKEAAFYGLLSTTDLVSPTLIRLHQPNCPHFCLLTWCTPPCSPRWPARSPRRPSAGEWKPSRGSPCPVQNRAPHRTPPGCSLWKHRRTHNETKNISTSSSLCRLQDWPKSSSLLGTNCDTNSFMWQFIHKI